MSDPSQAVDPDFFKMPQYAYVYLDQVVCECEAWQNANSGKSLGEKASTIIKKYRDNNLPATWGELFELELVLARSEQLEALQARLTALTARHAGLRGGTGTSFPPPGPNATKPEVLAHVESTLREIHRLLAVTACRERLRRRRLTFLIILVVIVVGLLLLAKVLPSTYLPHWTIYIPLMGMLGGLVSSQQRMQNAPNAGDSLTDVGALYFDRASLLTSALSGAIFAIILSLMFAGELIKSGVFPEVVPPGKDMDEAKLLVWCFIAGFAERFVPGMLDRLVAKGDKEPSALSPHGK